MTEELAVTKRKGTVPFWHRLSQKQTSGPCNGSKGFRHKAVSSDRRAEKVPFSDTTKKFNNFPELSGPVWCRGYNAGLGPRRSRFEPLLCH